MMINKKKLQEETLLVRRAILAALPTDVSFAAIIIALAEVIKMMQEQALEDDEF